MDIFQISRIIFLFVATFLLSTVYSATSAAKPRIAVIGAGAGGTGVSYFLTKLLNKNVHIEIYEKSNLLGGRMKSVEILGNQYEAGGSIIHPKNELAVKLVKDLGLRQKTDIGGFGFSIMDGEEVVFSASKWSLITLYRLLYRYGFQLKHLRSLTDTVINDFTRIYDLQDKGTTFKDPAEMLELMSPLLLNLTKSDYRTYLTDHGFKKSFIEEFVQAITYINYGQDTSMHSFVGSVATAGADDGLWSVQQGNWHLANALFNNSVAKLHFNSGVTSIKLNDDGTYGLSVNSVPNSEIYDQVVIANPLEVSRIKFENFKTDPYAFNDKKYHRTVATFVAGHLKEKYLHLVDIFTCTPNSFYTTLSRVFPTKLDQSEKYPVYKFFSQVPISQEQLRDTFEEVKVLHEFDWQAYPHYEKVPPKLTNFLLHPGLYYVNAIEWAASAIEMSLISARNIALLIAQESNGNTSGESTASPSQKKTEL